MAGGGGCSSIAKKKKKPANRCCFLFLVVLLNANIQQGVEGARGGGGGGGGTQVAPRIVDDPSNVTVLRNEPATLRCAVDGQPQPEVTWYRDGEALEPRGHRLVLPDGALFFLRVTQGRSGGGGGGGGRNSNNNGDAGTYWCVARNAAGMARSRNATLTVAYLQPDFRRVPEASRSVVGESVRMQCQAPKGQPEAEVTWRKNGVSIGAWDDDLALDKERIHVEETGDLIIRHVLASDEGKYQCVAHNMAATRESPAVSLSVYVRPQVSIPQPDLMVVVGDEASFECQASGDPTPELLWRRLSDNSVLPVQQSTGGDNRSTFKIERVELSDAGAYACEVENAVGRASSTAVLTVLIPPTWSPEPPPSEIQTEAGRPLAIDCSVTGTPTPLIFWRREGAAMDNSSRWSIALNGTLMIHNIQPEDAGSLYCAAVNAGGALLARVNLEVTLPIHSVPPHFLIGPANQTLPIRSPALLQCQVARPDPDSEQSNTTEMAIHWTRDGLPLNQNSSSGSGSSFQILQSGSLQIDHLKVEDSGTYTCWATVLGGNAPSVSSWTANLLVENPINPNVAFNRAPSDPLALPGPPSQPVATNQTAHSVTVTWQSSSRMGASPLIGYTVEIYSPKASTLPGSWSWSDERNEVRVNVTVGWLVAARRLKSNSFTIDGLTAGTWLLCLVRAENSHGLSLPSPISRWIYSTSASSSGDADLTQTRDLLSGSLLHLDRVQSISSTTVELHWDIVDGESYIEGLYLYHFESSAPSLLPVPVQSSQVIKDPGSMSHIVYQLRPDTNYTFFLVPFYGSVEGRPSNSRTIKTNPDAPSGYPQNVTVKQFNDSSVLIQWLPPPEEECNGVIIAYQIFVYSAETGMLLANLTLPSTSTSIAVGGLDGGTRYAFRAAAWTQVGLGPNSPAVVLAVEVNQATSTVLMTDPEINSFPSNVAQETWMIILVGGTLLVLLLTVILVVIIRRRKVCKHQNRAANGRGAQNGSRGNQSHLLWPLPTQPWMNNCSTNGVGGDPTKEVHPQLGPDYAEVFHHANPSMSSFNTQPTAAYASTTLIRNTTSSLPFRYQPTGRSVPHLDPSASSGGMMSRNSSQPLVPNWLEMLPPPPQHPPPPLVVSPDRVGSSSNSSNAKGEFPPSFLTATLPSTIQQHYPFRSSYNAQSQPTLLAQHVRNSYLHQQQQQQQQYRNSGMGRYQSDEIPQEGLYATCTYDQIEPYPLSSYR